jgi:hypothetical protein
VVSFTPRPLYLRGKSSWYPVYRRLGWPQSRSGQSDEKSQPLPGIEPPIILPVAKREADMYECCDGISKNGGGGVCGPPAWGLGEGLTILT